MHSACTICHNGFSSQGQASKYNNYQDLLYHGLGGIGFGLAGGALTAGVSPLLFLLIEISRSPCCVLLALSWNTNENPSTDKLSRAINYFNPPITVSKTKKDPQALRHTCKKRVMLRRRLFWPKKNCGKSA